MLPIKIGSHDGHLCWRIGPKKYWVIDQTGEGGHLCWWIELARNKNHQLGRGRRVLTSCQDLSKSVRRLQRSKKCVIQSETRRTILVNGSGRTKLLGTLSAYFVKSLVKICSAVAKEKSKMHRQIRGHGCHLCWRIDWSDKHSNVWKRTLSSYFLSSFVKIPSAVAEKSKCLGQSGARTVFWFFKKRTWQRKR